MKVSARCNKRHCQARRNLSMSPNQYVRWPKCHVCGEGKMYVDKYRMRKGPKDRAPTCNLDCYPFPHGVDSKDCKQHLDHLLERNLSPRSKHSPIINQDPIPF